MIKEAIPVILDFMDINIKRNQLLKDRARILRLNMTKPEKKLWHDLLSKKQLLGIRFIRQRIIGNFIVDFYCAELKLAIEVDGGIHDNKQEYDSERSNELKSLGINIVRISNEHILYNIVSVKESLLDICCNSPLYQRGKTT